MATLHKTKTQLKREKRAKSILKRLATLSSLPGAMPTAVIKQVAKEYKVCTKTVYNIRQGHDNSQNDANIQAA